jgi:RND family efflux transporter MFP subunit
MSEQNFARMSEVFERGVISQDDFDRIKTNHLNAQASVKAAEIGISSIESEISSLTAELNRATLSLEKTSLFAPFDGVITAMNITENNHYYPPMSGTSNREREATSAIVIIDDASFEVQLEININDAQRLQEGQTVYLANDDELLYHAERTQTLDQNVAMGTIWSVSPSLNLQRRSQTVKVRVNQHSHQLKEGQFIRAWIAADTLSDTVALPLHALSFKNGEPFVYVVNTETNTVERRNITIGSKGIDRLEITSGLSHNEMIVTRGQHLLVDGSQISVVGGSNE